MEKELIPMIYRRIKRRDRFKESDEMSERVSQFWIEWLRMNEKSLVDEIGDNL